MRRLTKLKLKLRIKNSEEILLKIHKIQIPLIIPLKIIKNIFYGIYIYSYIRIKYYRNFP